MKDFKPSNTNHIVQDMKGQAILAGTIMLSIVTGVCLLSHSNINTYAAQSIKTGAKTPASETPAIISRATSTLSQYINRYSHQIAPGLIKTSSEQYTAIPQSAASVTLDIITPQVTKLNAAHLYKTLSDTSSNLGHTTTAMLGQANSPFSSYGRTAKNLYKKEGIKVASLSEIDSFLALDHNQYSYVDNKYFLKNVKNKLPQYKNTFKKAAHKHGLDWRLVASIAYQESVWDPTAVSPTGVKGMMMLTRVTAKEMKVKNRKNATESIFGGTGYFKKLLKRVPAEVKGADRTLMALAAYNMGYGHLIAARKLTAQQNADNTKWSEVKKRLPLLQQKQYYSKSKYGYATGARQAIHYVAEIQKHYDMLLMLTEKPAIEQGKISNNAINGFAITRYIKS